jgi:hypothetical protein
VIVLVLGVALATLGLSRLTIAGTLMVVITAVPLVLTTLGAGFEQERLITVAVGLLVSPVLVSGLLYLWAGHLVGDAPGAADRTGPSKGRPAPGSLLSRGDAQRRTAQCGRRSRVSRSSSSRHR